MKKIFFILFSLISLSVFAQDSSIVPKYDANGILGKKQVFYQTQVGNHLTYNNHVIQDSGLVDTIRLNTSTSNLEYYKPNYGGWTPFASLGGAGVSGGKAQRLAIFNSATGLTYAKAKYDTTLQSLTVGDTTINGILALYPTYVGTVSINGTTSVTGSGTDFLHTAHVGDYIKINGEIKQISVVTNSGSITVSSAFTSTISGVPYLITDFSGAPVGYAFKFDYNGDVYGENGLKIMRFGAVQSYLAIGRLALNAATSAARCTGVGELALTANTTGNDNTATGYNALIANTTGSANTAYGANAGTANLTADNMTAIGRLALSSNTGANNTALGGAALSSLITGTNNVGVGYNVQTLTTSDIYSIVIGSNGQKTRGSNTSVIGTIGHTTDFYAVGKIHGTTSISNATDSLATWSAIDSSFKRISFVHDSTISVSTSTTLTLAQIGTSGWLVINADATSGAINITLPATASWKNLHIRVRKTDASANAVTVLGTIDGATNYSLATQYKRVGLDSDGTNIYTNSTN